MVEDVGPADPARLRHDVEVLATGPRSRRHAPEAMVMAEEYVTGELTAAGWLVHREPFTARWAVGCTDRHGNRALPLKVRVHPRLTGANLRAELPGAAPGPAMVIGAHLDTVYRSPGADDNASGVAVVLEVARLLAARPERPAVTLMIFDHEEVGLIGARAAARTQIRSRPIAGMVCLESVGYFADAPETQRLPKGAGLAFGPAVAQVREAGHRGDFTLVVHRRSSQRAAELWRAAAARADPALPAVLLRDPRPDGPLGAAIGLAVPALGHLGRSDHAAYWNRRIPALMLTGTANFRNAHYHQASDVAETLDYGRLATVATATAHLAAAGDAFPG
ncbi:M28 family peptidase [Nocardia brasiliensis]|uniref:M28 family peptidase n=1 Tax=Nocardia brasiliensis TaxID=37326 RepID=UPI003D92C9E9